MPRGGRENDESSEQQDGVNFETLRDEGHHFVHVKQFHKAIESFTKALEMKEDDQNCLVTRSKCHLQLGNAEASLADAERALELNKMLIRGLYQKAEALYQKGDFETALVFYHRGHKLRPELQEFRLGIQKSQEAINNSIGEPDSVKLSANKGDMSYFYKQEEAKKQQRGGYQKPVAKKEEKKEREMPKGSSDTKTVKQLLGVLYGDKDFLDKLLADQCLKSSSTRNDNSRDIRERVCDGLDYLNSRADFWRQQKPMYARKRDKERQQRALKSRSRKDGSMDKVLRNLEDIDEAYSDGRYQESLDKARNTLKLVEHSSDDEIQNKAELIASLHSSMGNAYLELGKLNQAMDHHEKDLEIAKDCGLEDARSRALDNLGRVYARKGDFEKAIGVWQEKIPVSKSALESTWLYHEIGRCYLELGKYSNARDYGEKSLAAAKDASDGGWQLHASVLVAQSEVKLGEYQAASQSFEKSLEMAKQQHDEAAEQAIEKALEEVNDKIVRGVKDDDRDDEDEDKKGDTTDAEKYNYTDDFETDKEPLTSPTRPKSPPPKPALKPRSPEPQRPKSVTYKDEKEEQQKEEQRISEEKQQKEEHKKSPEHEPEPEVKGETETSQQQSDTEGGTTTEEDREGTRSRSPDTKRLKDVDQDDREDTKES